VRGSIVARFSFSLFLVAQALSPAAVGGIFLGDDVFQLAVGAVERSLSNTFFTASSISVLATGRLAIRIIFPEFLSVYQICTLGRDRGSSFVENRWSHIRGRELEQLFWREATAPTGPLCDGAGGSRRSPIKVTGGASWQRVTFRTRQGFGRDLFGMADDRRFQQMRRIEWTW
jgi:hypothetical protein